MLMNTFKLEVKRFLTSETAFKQEQSGEKS